MKNIFELIKKDWKGNEPLQSACTRIYEYLLGVVEHPDFYTFGDFEEVPESVTSHQIILDSPLKSTT